MSQDSVPGPCSVSMDHSKVGSVAFYSAARKSKKALDIGTRISKDLEEQGQ